MSFPSELKIYVGRMREFTRIDWLVYVAWVGLMLGLVFATGGFLLAGHVHGVTFTASPSRLKPGWSPSALPFSPFR
jgi:hypothetical protein